MNRIICIEICLVLALASTVAHGYEEHVVVKKRDRRDNTTYAVMTRSELRKLEYTNRREKILHVKALAKATKAWKEDPSNKGKSFPRSIATPVDVRAMKGYRNKEDATEEANRYTRQEEERLAKKKRDQKEKYAIYYSVRNNGNRRRTQKKRYDMKRYNTALEREAERTALIEKAASLYESALKEVRNQYESRRGNVRAKQEEEYGTPTPPR